jgi:putative ABC transport system permease protein
MFKNYLVVAARNFWRNKIFSSINVLGLSVGISASLVLFLIVYYEFSFDKFEKDRNRIYRVTLEISHNGETNRDAAVPAPVGQAAARELTGLDQTVPLFQFQGDATAKVSITKDDPDNPVVYKKQPDIIFTNDDYFAMLTYQWLAGSPVTALKEPFTVVLTESRAHQYFPNVPVDNIMGQVITYNDNLKVTVSGIVKDLDEHTFFTQAEFISLPTVLQTELKQNFMMDTWNDWMAYSQLFIKTSKGTSGGRMEANLNSLLKKYNKDADNGDFRMAFRLQPLSDVHFNYGSVGHRTAHKPTLYGLLTVAVFLLLLGCINFINLTTAQSTQRAKEIGIRKTIGSSKRQLILQFLSETLLITVAASVLAIIITPFLLNMFSGFIPPGLHFDLLAQPSLIIFLVLLVLAISLLSGIYPALVLSRFRPASVLKSQVISTGQTDKTWLRKTLTVSQFVIAQFFVIATLMVSKQIHYSLNKDLGFKKDAIITLMLPRDTSVANANVLLQKVNAVPEIAVASLGYMPPASDGPAYTNVTYNNGKEDIKGGVQIRWGDTNYLRLYNIELLAGRNVMQSDTIKEFLVNDTYAKKMGFQHPSDAIGALLNFNGKMKPVVGVMHDFHELSFHDPIEPIVFTSFNKRNGFLHVALKPQNAGGTVWQSAISKLEKAYKEVYPEKDFSYNFFDESIAGFYKSEENTSRLLKWSTGLAILISCLGLLGLVVYTTNARRKEIGIRKVMGATITQIVSILSKDFISLVILAFVIAAPVAWWAVHKWLEDFTYRTEISWWLFVISGLLMLVAALFTLGIQTVRSAMANPVKSLRTE